MEIARRVGDAVAALRDQAESENVALTAEVAVLVCFGTEIVTELLDGSFSRPYHLISGMPTGSSEPGDFHLGHLSGRRVVVLSGGPDLYQGHRLAEACVPVWVAARLGVRHIVLIDAALGIGEDQACGDLLAVTDHIDFMPDNPLRGHDHEKLGPSYPDMSRVYHPELRARALEVARGIEIPMHSGVLAARAGPANETPAELTFLRHSGIDAVANSLVPEAIAAHHAGLEVLGLSALLDTNPAPHRSSVVLESMVEAAEIAAGRLQTLLTSLVTTLTDDGG